MSEILLRARGLSRRHPVRKQRLFERATYTTALDDADIDVRAGSAVGVIGESGSGKSTLVRLLLALDSPTSGTVEFDGRPVDADANARSLHWLRRQTGIVFQDPYASLDPRMSVGRIVGEPLWALGVEGDRRARACGKCCRTWASRPRWPIGSRTSSRAASVSASRSRGRSCTARDSSSATSPCRRST